MKFYEQLLEILADAGVTCIFGVPGDAINPLIDALRTQDRIRFIHVVHEEAGALAASAQAKLTGQLAVCAGTVGPGAIHLLNGLYDAARDRAPVLAITGQVPTVEIGFEYHQEVDLQRLFSDVADFRATVHNVCQMPRIAVEACHAALSNRGVSVLTIPHDVGKQDVEDAPWRIVGAGGRYRVLPPDEELDRAAGLIERAKRVSILYGEGCRSARSELLAFAEKLKAPMVYSLKAKDLIPGDHRLVAGGLGLLGTKGGLEAIESCDLLVVLGSDFPYRDWYPEKVPIIRVDCEGRAIGRRTSHETGLIGDCRSVLEELTRRVSENHDETHLDSVHAAKEDWDRLMRRLAAPDRTEGVIHPQAVAAALSNASREGAVFTCDTGAVTVWGARHLDLREGQRLLYSFNLATMAFAMPGAIGIQLLQPDRQVIALCGDGGFNMLMGDFLTAVKYALPIKAVIFNNGRLGLIQMEQEVEGYPEHETDLLNPDYTLLARAFGAAGRSVSRPSELRDAVDATLAEKGPAILDVRIKEDELAMPPRIEARQAWGFARARVKEWLSQHQRGE
jgi:thiamine pyrophosphate-dependent acetolactate synthase large subunit-like protein